jgi:hypothetical protein
VIDETVEEPPSGSIERAVSSVRFTRLARVVHFSIDDNQT